ncbi:MAG: [LysW]-aminoadipate kinase [Gammaproteobacteria bacterium]|nr:[LysW]-aminoadipate kinase [Gammaproteobacteria bacterium]
MLIIKIGGGASINLAGIVDGLTEVREPCILVHGANALRDSLAEKLRSPKQVITSVSGYDSVFSDATAIDMILMSYAGLRNKRIVELCQQRGINAVGLTGIDGRLVQGARNKGMRVREGGKTLIKRDFSGKPKDVNVTLLRLLLDNGFVPVLTIPICDEQGCAVNSENDDIVTCLHTALQADKIIQFIEAPGLLADPGDELSTFSHLTRGDVETQEQQASGRMKRKLLAMKRLLDAGRASIVIADGRGESPLRDALQGAGTQIE